MSFRLLFDILVIYVALQQKMHRGTLQAEQRAGPKDPNVIFKGTEEWPLCSRCVPKSQDIWGFLQEAGSILTLGKCKKCLLSWLEEVHLFCTCCQILPAVFQYVAEVKPLCYPKMFSGLNVLTQLLSSGKSCSPSTLRTGCGKDCVKYENTGDCDTPILQNISNE